MVAVLPVIAEYQSSFKISAPPDIIDPPPASEYQSPF